MFGQNAIRAIVQAYEWADEWGVSPSATLVFFAALPLVLSNPKTIPLAEFDVRGAIAAGDEPGTDSLQPLIVAQATQVDFGIEILTARDLLLAAVASERDRIAAALSALSHTLGTVMAQMEAAPSAAIRDEPCPDDPDLTARYVVVVRKNELYDDSNQYASFADAGVAFASLSAHASGAARPAPPTDRYVIVVIPSFIDHATSITIRELR